MGRRFPGDHAGALALLCVLLVLPVQLAAQAPSRNFQRGDANASGETDLSDAIFTLGCLFLGTRCGSCPDALDANDSGAVDLSDAVYVLQWLFGGGPAPPSPGPTSCGQDPTADFLTSCTEFQPCGVSCTPARVAVEIPREPADLIIAVDSSGSMDDEVLAFEMNLNTGLAAVLEQFHVDYSVTLIAKHPSVCIPAPLGSGSCTSPPGPPVQNPPRFHQFSIRVDSSDALSLIVSTFDGSRTDEFGSHGWSTWAREEAFKTLIVITDDESSVSAAQFDTMLLALPGAQFGDATQRRYAFHSIIGLRANGDATQPYRPEDPVVALRCTTAVDAGQQYQTLSILTGGLRFPSCETTRYEAFLQSIARDTVSRSRSVCRWKRPAPPPGAPVDPGLFVIEYTPGGGGAPRVLSRVSDTDECIPGGFHVDGGDVVLCPEPCAAAEGDPDPHFDVVWTCPADA